MSVTRRNILNDSNVRDKYIEGVKLLKQDFLRQDWTNTYDIFIIWHYYAMMAPTPPGSGRNAAHRGPSFLPWHRWMLILLEHHLQRVLDDPDFGLPYWDWSSDGELPPNQQPTAPTWANDCMGGSGSPVTTGPFRDGQWKVNIESIGFPDPIVVRANRPLRRVLGRDPIASNLPTKEDVRRAVIRGQPNVVYDAAPWDTNSESFRNELEGWWPDAPGLHNRVHVWVGGDMAPASSPNDPVFYLNHANVDRLWEAWMQARGRTYVPGPGAAAALTGHRLNDALFNVLTTGVTTPVDMLDQAELASYDTL